MITLGLLEWLQSAVNSGELDEGDPVRIELESKNQKASEFDGMQGHIEEIIHNPDGKDGRLYKVQIIDSGDTMYLNRHQFEAL